MITVLGSTNIDLTCYSNRLPLPGETLHGDTYETGLGGKGVNQAIGVKRLGENVDFIGAVGDDSFGILAYSQIGEYEISTNSVRIVEGIKTGLGIIAVDAEAQNSITVIAGANMALSKDDLTANDALLRKTKILMLQLEVPIEVCICAAETVRKNGGQVILDPAPVPPSGLSDKFYECVDVLTPNETEAEALTGIRPIDEKTARQVALILREKGVGTVLVTLGEAGVFYMDHSSEGLVSPYSVESIDSVAAGDCFNSGYAVAISEGWDIDQSVRFAAACGALSTTKRGATASAPSRLEVEGLLASAQGQS